MKARMNQALNDARAQLVQQPSVQAAMSWYAALSARDQTLVKALALLCTLVLVFVMLYVPLLDGRKQAQDALERNLVLYTSLANNAGRFSAVSPSNAATPLLAVVTQQARETAVTLTRYEQDGQALRVWLDKVAFDEAIVWLESLQATHGVRATQLSIDRTEREGRVDIRATLSR